MAATDPAVLARAGVVGLLELIGAGRATAVDAVQTCLDRIDALNPTLNCFLDVRGRLALAEAAAADAARAAGDRRPLLGLPVAVKNGMDVAGLPTRRGAAAAAAPAAGDDPLVAALRSAGAVVVGTTTLPELAIWPWTDSPVSGVTRNPWDPRRTPGGSSGGSAAAVAAGLVPAATATDGGGSIRIPAACCGLVGFKPVHGRLPMGDPDHWQGMSHAGFLTRTVGDTAALLDALTPALGAAPVPGPRPGPLRIAVSIATPAPGRAPGAEQRAALDRTADLLAAAGHQVRRADPPYGAVGAAFAARYLRGIADDAAALAGPASRRTRALCRLAPPAPVLRRAHRLSAAFLARLEAFFAETDVLLTPVTARRPPVAGAYTEAGALRSLLAAATFVPYPNPWNVAGLPALSVPAGHDAAGLPLAVQLVGAADAEATLLAVGQQLQDATGWPAQWPTAAALG